jgi:hypothetical protein
MNEVLINHHSSDILIVNAKPIKWVKIRNSNLNFIFIVFRFRITKGNAEAFRENQFRFTNSMLLSDYLIYVTL